MQRSWTQGRRTAPAPRRSTAFVTIDLEAVGRRSGFIMVPHSPDDDAWGVTRIPIAVAINGTGPTVILQGGNHGDEYEGPIAISDFYRSLDLDRVSGRILFLPAVNVHAVMVGRRTSPVDGLNFNRVFPGNPLGTITEAIAGFIADHILPMGDVFLDLHSGGSSLKLIPSAVIVPTEDPDLHARNVAAARTFGAPVTLMIDNLGERRTATAEATRLGLVTLATEMAGGGSVTPEALQLCRQGIMRVLMQTGVYASETLTLLPPFGPLLQLDGPAAFVYASTSGVFEPCHELGAEVEHGDIAGYVHTLWDIERPPEALHFQKSGVLYGLRQPGHVRPGNCCLAVATHYQGIAASD